jgi:FAD:protein FMN transferase
MSVHVEHLMGTVIGVDVRDAESEVIGPAVAAFFDTLRDLEQRFSPWLPDSEISRIARGELAEADAPTDVRWVLAACDQLTAASGGAFNARRPDEPRPLDPSGLVKGWAVDEASRHLVEAGLRRYAVNAGGDALVRGGAAPHGWRVGIRHPENLDRLAAVLDVRSGAVATSGLYERGDHIRDARLGTVQREVRSLTVVGPELTWADAYATAGFAMGLAGLDWVAARPGYGALAVTADDQLIGTPSIAGLLIRFSGTDASIDDMAPTPIRLPGTREAEQQ